MPTINQLIRKGRRAQKSKSSAPALGFTQNTLRDEVIYNEKEHHKKRRLHQGLYSYAKETQPALRK